MKNVKPPSERHNVLWPYLQFSSSVGVSTYSLWISLITTLGVVWAYRRRPSVEVLDLSFCILIGGFVGARLFHILFEEPGYYINNPKAIFAIWQGGFVWFGGWLGALITSLLWCRWRKQSFLEWADLLTPVLAVGYGVGRLACFLNGCCYGVACSWPWAVSFHSHKLMGLEVIPRHPTQLYMAAYDLALGIGLLIFSQRRSEMRPGWLFLIWVVLHGMGRAIVEFWRDDPRGPLLLQLSVSTWIGITISICALLILLRPLTLAQKH